MDGSYRALSNKSLESNILFWGQENCAPNYAFKGNNVRDNYVIHYIQRGKGTFASANHSMVTLQAGMFLSYLKECLAFIKQMVKNLGAISG